MQRNEWYLQCIMIILFKFPVSSYTNSSNFDVMVHLFWNSFKNTEIIPTYFKHLHMMHFVICNLNLIIQRFGLTNSAYFWTNIWTWFLVNIKWQQLVIYQFYDQKDCTNWPKNLLGTDRCTQWGNGELSPTARELIDTPTEIVISNWY